MLCLKIIQIWGFRMHGTKAAASVVEEHVSGAER